MTKKKPPPERLRPKTDDAELALAEACKLLGCGGDPSKLCGADRVRVGMVAGLMAAVDAATESLLAGNSNRVQYMSYPRSEIGRKRAMQPRSI